MGIGEAVVSDETTPAAASPRHASNFLTNDDKNASVHDHRVHIAIKTVDASIPPFEVERPYSYLVLLPNPDILFGSKPCSTQSGLSLLSTNR